MELLPVIYWSLFSVGLLALVVIIVSFITFRFRKKYGNIPSTEVVGKERNKKVTITNPDKKPKTEKKHHPKVQTRSKYKKNINKSEQTKGTKDVKDSLYKKPNRNSDKKRIEIVNPDLESKSSTKESTQTNTEFHSLQSTSKKNGWN